MSQLIACPECSKHLQVPEDLLGKKVQCPECKHAFIAALPEVEVAPVPRPTPPKPAPLESPPIDEDDDRTERRRKRRESGEEDDFDDRPRRRRPPRYADHRGGMILAFGIIGLVGGFVAGVPFIFGLLAWIMGNNDLREMREGRMDPEGESMTNVGRILGMVATGLFVVGILAFCGVFGCIFFASAIGAANANKNFQQPKRF